MEAGSVVEWVALGVTSLIAGLGGSFAVLKFFDSKVSQALREIRRDYESLYAQTAKRVDAIEKLVGRVRSEAETRDNMLRSEFQARHVESRALAEVANAENAKLRVDMIERNAKVKDDLREILDDKLRPLFDRLAETERRQERFFAERWGVGGG
jgi:hypothetical protein